MEKFDLLIFIGRFQPLHNGHKHVIKTALEKSENLLILIGSSYSHRNLRNPFTSEEIEKLIQQEFSQEKNKIHTRPIKDFMYNDNLWLANVQCLIDKKVKDLKLKKPKIGLIGHKKDGSSFYLDLFPQYKSIEVKNLKNINATAIRKYLFNPDPKLEPEGAKYFSKLSQTTKDFLQKFQKTDRYQRLKLEADFLQKYKTQWEKTPYPPIFTTVDAVLVQSGYVLLVKRRAMPGKGLYALPGGFINPDESLESACLRELREETGIKVPLPVLKGSIQKVRTFDSPYRSLRGRTITTAFYIQLKPDKHLPKIKGGSDASKAVWKPLGLIEESQLFDDHYHIIRRMIEG